MCHRGKRSGNHVKEGKTCSNYRKIGHFARDCIEPKKVLSNFFSHSLCYVLSQVLIAHSLLEWIVDTGATDHVARDKVRFMEYHRISVGSQNMIMGNGTSVEVLCIGTYKLQLH